MRRLAALLFLLTITPALAQGDKTTPQTVQLPGGALAFDAVVATTKLADPKGAVQAEIVTTAFLQRGADATTRPVTFAVNGGPGASSAWLNLGAIGPWRIPFGDTVVPSAAAVPVDNAESWLDQTDLVFIDPPGTGYSRVTGTDEARRNFYSVQGDIDALATTIRRWLEANGRLAAPKFIVGESYGGFRGPKLARALLERQGVGVRGLFLISPVLDFNGRDAPFDPLRSVHSLPSQAAAYRHATERAAVDDVERYATGDFLRDLLLGLSDREATERLVGRVAALTGLDPAVVRRRAGRIGIGTAAREGQAPGQVLSPYDATLAAADPFPEAANDNSPDPLLDGMRGPITSAMLALYRDRMGWQPEGAPNRQYELLNDSVNHEWNYGRRQAGPEAFGDLRQFLALDPLARVVVSHGLTDLVTPYFADVLLLRQVPAALAGPRLQLLTYAGGHMFYSRDESRAALHADAMRFYRDALGAL